MTVIVDPSLICVCGPEVDIPKGRERPALPPVSDDEVAGKRFFYIDDGGCDYWFVARDAEHVRDIVIAHGLEFCDDDGWSHRWGHPKVAHLKIEEVTSDSARRIRCNTDDDGRGRGVIALAACDVGEWFCSEW